MPADQPARPIDQLRQRWGAWNWSHAADHYLATLDYSYLDYADPDTVRADQELMATYARVEPDTARYKDCGDVDGLVLPGAREALGSFARPLAQLHVASTVDHDLDLANLGGVMSATLGVLRTHPVRQPGRSPLIRRSSPSGGSRHPTEGYLVTRAVTGLSDGVHHFCVGPRRLHQVASGTVADRLLGTPTGGRAAMFLFTSVFSRNMYRYREPRTFRTIWLDAGHVVATTQLLCAGLGLETHRLYTVDPLVVEAALRLDPYREGFLVAVAVGNYASSAETAMRVPAGRPDPRSDLMTAAEVRGVLAAQGNWPSERQESAIEWFERSWDLSLPFYEAIRLSSTPPTVPSARLPQLPTPLLAADLAQISVGEALFRRVSARTMPKRQLQPGVLTDLLAWPEVLRAPSLLGALHVYLCAYGLAGVEPGIYLRRSDGTLEPVVVLGEATLRDEMQDIMVGQSISQHCAVTLLFVLDIEQYQRYLPTERGLVDAWIDCARLAQWTVVAATAFRVRTHQSPAVKDTPLLARLSRATVSAHVLYTISLG